MASLRALERACEPNEDCDTEVEPSAAAELALEKASAEDTELLPLLAHDRATDIQLEWEVA